MKSGNPTFSFSSSKSNYCESHEQEYNSQSNCVDTCSLASKPKQALHNNYGAYGRPSATKSTNYYAQANCAQPSSMINVVKSMTTKESNKTLIHSGHSDFEMNHERVKKSNHISVSTTEAMSPFGIEDDHMMGKTEQQSWAKNLDYQTGASKGNQSKITMLKQEHTMEKTEQGFANSPTPRIGNHSNSDMYELEDHMTGNVYHGPNLTSNFSSPNKPQGSGVNMYKEEHLVAKSDSLVVNSLPQLHVPAKKDVFGQSMYKEQHALPYGASQNEYKEAFSVGQNGYVSAQENAKFGAAKVKQSVYGTTKEGFGVAQGNPSAYGASQTNFGVSQGNHSAHFASEFGAPQGNQLAYSASQAGYGTAQGNYSARIRYKAAEADYSASHLDHGTTQGNLLTSGDSQAKYSATRPNHSSNSASQAGYSVAQTNQSTYPYSASQAGYKAGHPNHLAYGQSNTSYGGAQGNDHSAYGASQNLFKGKQDNHSAYVAPQNGFPGVQGNHSAYSGINDGYNNLAQGNDSANGAPQNRYGSVKANNSAYGASQNGYGYGYGSSQDKYSAYGASSNGFGFDQGNNSIHGVAQMGYAAPRGNQSTHAAYHYDDDEEHNDVHDIMDEILTKYPAHNISSSGNGSSWASTKGTGASYAAKQETFGGPSQHGIVRQSSSNNFQMKEDVKATGYVGVGVGVGVKKEFSHSSSSNKQVRDEGAFVQWN